MATRKKTTRVKTVANEDYSKLDQHCIWLQEYHAALRRAGFTNDNALWTMSSRETWPDWVNGITPKDIREHLEDEED
jgi:hypothetical protein